MKNFFGFIKFLLCHNNCLWIIVVVSCICIQSGVLSTDICQGTTKKEDIKYAVHHHSVPAGRLHAGIFTKNENAKDFPDCTYSCCLNKSCNSVFFHNETCYLIQCNTSWVGSCDPQNVKDPKFINTTYVTVRDVNYAKPKTDREPCDLDTGAGCLDSQDCQAVENHGNLVTECVCKHGLIWNDLMNECIEDVETQSAIDKLLSSSQSCEFGLLSQCGVHEECYLPEHSRTKNGKCICISGFHRNDDGNCVFGQETGTRTTSIPPSTTKVPDVRVCEFGILSHCHDNEKCYIQEESKKRSGICVCKDGFHKDMNGSCVSPNSVTFKQQHTKSTSEIDTSSTKKSHKSTSTTSTTPLPVTELMVGAGKNKQIQLPENSVTLNAYVVQKEEADEKFEYQWSLVTSPDGSEGGKMEGKNTDKLKLSNLIAGLYIFKIKVTGKNRAGEAAVNVTVLPPARKNTPPVAKIKPTHQEIKLPNTPILDGSASTDDDKIVSYHWQEVSGPLQDHKIDQDTAMLRLNDLAPGVYVFKLTVKDSDGATNSTLGNVTVIKETDYPPKANAGSDVVIHLPQKTVTLYGNLSTDDKGIQSYEWIKAADDKLTADMQGVRSPILKLSNLQLGDYTFTLKVTDTADQVSTADVHVFVKPDVNQPPNAVTAGKITEFLPLDSLVLDGHNSTDDKGITKFEWEQIGGPTTLKITDANKVIAKASGIIKVGTYKFELTAYDIEQIHSVAPLTVEIKEKENKPPVANAGGDKSLTLPLGVATLDGSKSTDDKGIVHYQWRRDSSSLAAGEVINGSDHQAVLQLVNLVSGQYIFSLTVMDSEGLSSTDSASLIVKEDPHKEDQLELELDTDLRQFKEEDKANMQNQLALMLPKSTEGDTAIKILHINTHGPPGRLQMVFYAVNQMKETQTIRNGVETLQTLKEKLHSSGSHILNYHVISLDTVVCQNNCSGHGVCDIKTKRCICEAFWMENLFSSYLLDADPNCDWSVLYVIIICFIVVVGTAAIVWALVCWCKKRRYRCKWRTKKRHRYSLLQEVDYKDEMELLPKGKIQNSSVMISESDFSSDEETLFVNHKKANGFLQKPPNGISKQHLKTKLRT